MNYRKIGALGLILTVLGLASCSTDAVTPSPVAKIPTVVARTATPAVVGVTYTVKRGEVADTETLKGRVTAAVDQDVAFTTDGHIKTLQVQPKDTVTQGQLLAELDPGDLITQLEHAKEDLSTLESTIKSTQQQKQSAVAMAQVGVKTAKDNLEKAQRPPATAADIAAAQDTLATARITLVSTRNSLSAAKTQAKANVESAANALRNLQDAYSQLIWQGNNTQEQRVRLEQAQRGLKEGEETLRLARVAYDLAVQNEINGVAKGEQDVTVAERKITELQKGPDPLEIRTAQHAVESAQITLQSALASSEDPQTVVQRDQAQRTIKELEGKLEALQIFAPLDGVVAEVGVKVGDKVEPYTPVINIIDPAKLVLTVADIPKEDLAQVVPDQSMDITFARYPDQTITGTAEQLPSDQTSPTSQVRGNTFLRVAFPQGDRSFDIGDAADVKITFQREENALWLPPQALRHVDQRTYVVLKDGTKQREVDVTTGIEAEQRIQIVDGLSEGDVVVADTGSK